MLDYLEICRSEYPKHCIPSAAESWQYLLSFVGGRILLAMAWQVKLRSD